MADINILMMGGRRAGKTSLLAAVKTCCDKQELDMLNLSVSKGLTDLNEKADELQKYFDAEEYRDKQLFEPDGQSDDNPRPFEFKVDVNEFKSFYTIGFTDVPGEFYGMNEFGDYSDEEFEEVQEYISDRVRESQVFMIAIDTPHLMEKVDRSTGYGVGHEWFNRVPQITNFFKTAFQDDQPRLVLFVPIKCEKYRNKMDKVLERVQKGYEELIRYLTNEVADLTTVAVTPVITLGGACFLRFQNNDWHQIGEYYFDEDKREYAPEYCEQPLMYILKYLMETAKSQKESKHVLVRWFQERFLHQARIADLLACEDEIELKIIEDPQRGFARLHP